MAGFPLSAHDEAQAAHYTLSIFPKSGGQKQLLVPFPLPQKRLLPMTVFIGLFVRSSQEDSCSCRPPYF